MKIKNSSLLEIEMDNQANFIYISGYYYRLANNYNLSLYDLLFPPLMEQYFSQRYLDSPPEQDDLNNHYFSRNES